MANLDDLARNSLEQSNQIAARKRQLKRETGLGSKTYEGFDADQGSLLLKDTLGGTTNANQQGQLSNAGIATGKQVAPYADETADWIPTLSRIGGEDIQPEPNIDSEETQDKEENPPPDDLDGIPELPPLDPPEDNPYCQCKTVWVRGTPDRSPIPEIPEPTFEGGQCDGDNYTFNYQAVVNGTPSGTINSGSGEGPIFYRNRTRDSPPGQISEIFLGDGTVLVCGSASDPNTVSCQITNVVNTDGPDDCGNQQRPFETGPEPDTDPGAWSPIKVCDLPVDVSVDENSVAGKKQVIVSGASGEVGRLGYDENESLDIRIRCSEEGPP